jgi:hypothetical protein
MGSFLHKNVVVSLIRDSIFILQPAKGCFVSFQ